MGIGKSRHSKAVDDQIRKYLPIEDGREEDMAAIERGQVIQFSRSSYKKTRETGCRAPSVGKVESFPV